MSSTRHESSSVSVDLVKNSLEIAVLSTVVNIDTITFRFLHSKGLVEFFACLLTVARVVANGITPSSGTTIQHW